MGIERSGALLIVRPDGIGDFVLWLDSARVLREHFRGWRIILVTNQINRELAEKVGYFDEVIALDSEQFREDLRYRFRSVRQIRNSGAEVAIQPIWSRRFWTGDAMIRASGAGRRMGFEGDRGSLRPWQRRIAQAWYTDLIPSSEKSLSELERNAEFLRGLDIEVGGPTVAKLSKVAELPSRLRISGDYFIVVPGAGSPKRMWPAESFAAVARSVADRTGWRVVVCGSGREAEITASVIEHAQLEDAVDLAGRTSVPELVELVRGARLVIANETSAVHIAAAVGTPSVCVLGGGHFGRFMPYPASAGGTQPVAVFERMACYDCNWHCTQPHEPGRPVPCITAIRVEDVMSAVDACVTEDREYVERTH